MIRFLLISIGIFLLFGCSTIKPPVTEYRITTDAKVTDIDSNGCKNKSLKIAQAFSQNSLMSLKMNYILSNKKMFSYSQAHWSETPNRAVSLELLKQIRDTKLFKYTQNYKSRSRSDLLLETNIEDFIQYYNDDLSKSHAVITISFSLIDMKTNMTIADKTFSSKIIASSNDAIGGANALNNALDSVLLKTRLWLGEICK